MYKLGLSLYSTKNTALHNLQKNALLPNFISREPLP